MKRTLIVFFSIFCMSQAFANIKNVLVLQMKDDIRVLLTLEKRPVIKYDADDIIVNSVDKSAVYSLYDVQKLYFIEGNTDIDDVESIAKDYIRFIRSGKECIIIEGLDEKDQLTVYDINGVKCEAAVSHNDSYVEVELDKLPRGVFIISVAGRQSIKISH